MAPLVHMLNEAAEWLRDGCAGPSRATGFLTAPLSWEWLTIGVFSCGTGCKSSPGEENAGTSCIVEEIIVIANE